MVNDLSTPVQFPAQKVNENGFTLNLSAVLLIESLHLISLMSIVKSSRTSERDEVGDVVAQWISAVG